MRQRQKKPFFNFREGIKAVPAFFGGEIKDILNWKVSDNGFLEPRQGSRLINIEDTFESQGAISETITFPDGARHIDRRNVYDQITPDTQIATLLWEKTERRGNTIIGQTPVNRIYYLPKNATHVNVRNERFMLIAEDAGNFFIDAESNRRYDWNLNSPYIMEYNEDTYTDAFRIVRARLVSDYNAGNFRGIKSAENFPFDRLVNNDDNIRVEAWRAVFYNPDLEIRSKVSNTFARIYDLDPILEWLSEPYDLDEHRETEDYRYHALLHDELITQAEETVIQETIENTESHITLNISELPDWANHVELYRAFLDEGLLTSTEIEIDDSYDAGDIFNAIEVGVGTGLTIGGLVLGNTFGIGLGILGTVTGITGFILSEGDSVGKRYEIDRENLAGYSDENFQRRINEPIYFRDQDEMEVSVKILEKNSFIYLDAQYNESPPEQMNGITKHAGRIYGVDTDSQDIVFSHIDGNGINQWFSFPPQNRLSTENSGQSPIQNLQVQPSKGGIYALKRDAIHFIDGKNIWSGLYDIEVGTNTDIDASGTVQNTGLLTQNAIANNGSEVVFIGNNRQVYAMAGRQFQPIGVDIKPFIEDIPDDALEQISVTYQNEQFYLILPDSVLVLDTERKYWTRQDWNIQDIYWYQGRAERASNLLALTDRDTIELNVDSIERFGQLWECNTQISETHSLVTALYVYTDDEKEVKVEAMGNEPPQIVERFFTPTLQNRYRVGFHLKTRHLNVRITTEEPILIDRIDIEVTA